MTKNNNTSCHKFDTIPKLKGKTKNTVEQQRSAAPRAEPPEQHTQQ